MNVQHLYANTLMKIAIIICQYSDELCDIPFIDNCSMIDADDLCSVCERAVYCGLKGGDSK